jgi:hypothetical protein
MIDVSSDYDTSGDGTTTVTDLTKKLENLGKS